MDIPSFFDPAKVGDVWPERAALCAEAAHAARNRGDIGPARPGDRRIAAFGIDCQIGFCTPGASLFVPGAVEDTERTVRWLYRNMGALTELVFSLDTHAVHQVFHPAFWMDVNGRPPAPFTVISEDDVQQGRYTPRDPRAREYVQKLAQSGKYALTIWPYHVLLGGVSHALVPALMEAAIFHAVARDVPTVFETKGQHPLTENYSVLSTEVAELGGQRVGAFNDALCKHLLTFDRIYVFGQAKSHCVLSTLRDLADHVEDQALLSRIHVLTDAMSPVPAPPLDPLPDALNFPKVADRALAELAERGMVLCKTTDPIA
jgi:nicotinamidase-related amidase